MALTNEAYQSALAMADLIDSRGRKLMAVPESPLDQMVKQCFAGLADAIVGSDHGQVVERLVFVTNATEPGSDVSRHDLVADHWIQTGIDAVTKHMNVAKTIVMPAVRELAEAVTNRLANGVPSELVGMDIRMFALPDFANNPTFVSSVRRFEEVSYDSPTLNMHLPATYSDSELVDMMLTGSGGLDDQIMAWAAGLPGSFLQTLWTKAFTREGDVNCTFRELVEDQESGLNAALAINLWSAKLFDNPPEGVEMSINTFNDTMGQFRDQSAAKICRLYDEIDRAIKLKTLIRTFRGRTTVVYANVYQEWMEEEGCNEMLFGNSLLDYREYQVEAINARKDELLKLWERHRNMVMSTEASNNFSRTISALDGEFRRILNESGEQGTDGNRDIILEAFGKELECLDEDDVKDLHKTCLRLVCKARFPKTRAMDILGSIDRNMAENPSLDVNEAALLSLVEYVADWVCSQITMTKA